MMSLHSVLVTRLTARISRRASRKGAWSEHSTKAMRSAAFHS